MNSNKKVKHQNQLENSRLSTQSSLISFALLIALIEHFPELTFNIVEKAFSRQARSAVSLSLDDTRGGLLGKRRLIKPRLLGLE